MQFLLPKFFFVIFHVNYLAPILCRFFPCSQHNSEIYLDSQKLYVPLVSLLLLVVLMMWSLILLVT
jgi:hypothetical protein